VSQPTILGSTDALPVTETDLEKLNLYGDLTSLPKSEEDDSLEGDGGSKGETPEGLRNTSVPVGGTEAEGEGSDTPSKKAKNRANNPNGAKRIGREVWKGKMEQRQNAFTSTIPALTRGPEVGKEGENAEQGEPKAKRQRTMETS
jgi:hypothetical protein